MEDFRVLLAEANPDIFCLNETYLTDQDEAPDFDGYTVHLLNRPLTVARGGGVMVGVKEHLIINKITKKAIKKHEFISFELVTLRNIKVIAMYQTSDNKF